MSNIDVLFCDVISLLAQVFIVSFDRAYNQSINQSFTILTCVYNIYNIYVQNSKRSVHCTQRQTKQTIN